MMNVCVSTVRLKKAKRVVAEVKKGQHLKLPESVDDFQCPNHDAILTRIFQILEVCSFAITGDDGCESCQVFKQCRELYDKYSYMGEDKLLKPQDLIDFVEEFGYMRYMSKRLL